MAKIAGLHLNQWVGGMVEYIGETQPGWVKVLEQNRGETERAMTLSPATKWIGRMHRGVGAQRDYIRRQEEGAEKFFRDLTSQSLWPIIDTWEGINEPGNHPTPEYYRFQLRLAALIAGVGKKYLAEGTSVGTWSGSESDPFHDDRSTWVHEVARASHGINKHEYGAPHMRSEFMWNPAITEKVGGFYTLRYRQAYRAMPEDARVPLYITECGIDSGITPPWPIPAQGGWRSFTTAEDYVEQLKWYLGCCKEDGYVKAITPFCTYSTDPTWYTYSMWDGEIRDLWGEVLHDEEDGSSDVPEGWIDVRETLLKHPEWGTNPDHTFVTHPQEQFDEVIIHHSGDEHNDVWDIANHHVVNNRWAAIGYHMVIGKDGSRYWCHNFNVQAAHTYGHNDHTVGICLIGDLNNRWPTEAQLRSMKQVLPHIPFEFTIKAHRDYRNTDCPGRTFDEWRYLLVGGSPPPTENWEERALVAEDQLDRIEGIVNE